MSTPLLVIVRVRDPGYNNAAAARTGFNRYSSVRRDTVHGEFEHRADAFAVLLFHERANGPEGVKRAGRCHSADSLAPRASLVRPLSSSNPPEFLRRYLQHVPPSGQHRVRYFGRLHSSAKARRMHAETLLQKPIIVAAPPPEPVQWHLQCPHCHGFSLVRVGSLPRLGARAPPRCTR